MIQAVKTSRGLVVISMLGGWGDSFEVALLDADLEPIAAYEVSELLSDEELAESFAALGFTTEEVDALAARFAPPSNPSQAAANVRVSVLVAGLAVVALLVLMGVAFIVWLVAT